MRVLITGCFDIVHPGHIYLFKKGAELGEVYVIVARDSTISKYKRCAPIIPEDQRLAVIQAIKYVTHATLGNENNDYIRKALSLEPDLILLGPNQRISVSELRKELDDQGGSHVKIKRVQEVDNRFPLNSSSKIKKKIIRECDL
jgi:FAD synthetase